MATSADNKSQTMSILNCSRVILNATTYHAFENTNGSIFCAPEVNLTNALGVWSPTQLPILVTSYNSSMFRGNCSCVNKSAAVQNGEMIDHGTVFTLDVQIVLYIVNALIFVLGTTGNVAVMCILGTKEKLTSGDVLTISLAVADLLQSICGPISMYNFVISQHADWYLSEVGCYLFGSTSPLWFFATSFHLVVIALDRYRVVVQPLRERVSISSAFSMTLNLWLLAFSATAPFMFEFDFRKIGDKNGCGYLIDDTDVLDNMALFYCYGLLQSFIPLIFLIVTYCFIISHLRKGVVSMDSNPAMAKRRAENQKAVNMLVAVVVLFMMLTIPFSVYHMVFWYLVKYEVDWLVQNFGFMLKLDRGIFVTFSVSSAVNPVIYSRMHKDIKSAITQCIRNCRKNTSRVLAAKPKSSTSSGNLATVPPLENNYINKTFSLSKDDVPTSDPLKVKGNPSLQLEDIALDNLDPSLQLKDATSDNLDPGSPLEDIAFHNLDHVQGARDN